MDLFRKALAVIGAVIVIAALGIGARSLIVAERPVAAVAPGGPGVPSIGGPFTLTDHSGKRVSDADYRGRHMLISFGYTFCPDVCPTALTTMAAALDQLGPELADKVVPIFVTVDPERDTPEALGEYVVNFHPAMVGLSGTSEDIAAVAKAFRVYFAKAEQPDGPYLMDHSSIIYFMGPDGTFRTHFNHTTTPEQMSEAMRKYLSGQSS